MSYRAFWQRRCRAAAAGAVLEPLGGNCAVLPLHRKTEYDSRCLFMPPFGAWERVKGKRVQIPHDLVTVIREPAARVLLHRSLGVYPGRRRWALIFQPGNLPAAGYGGKRPRSRGIGCTVKNLLKARGLLCCHSACKRPRFLVGPFWCTPFCVCGRPALYRPSVI